MRRLLPFTLLGLCLLSILWQQAALDQERRAQPALLAAQEIAERLAAENAELARQDPASSTAAPDLKELLRLRNETRQLRALPQEIARLRALNERLTAEAQRSAQTGKLSEQEGYQARDGWTDAGLASPEATVQTFFRAVRDQDTPRLLQCLSKQGGSAVGIRLDPKTGELPASSAEVLRLFSLVQGYRVEARTDVGEDKVALSLRATTGGALLVWVLVRTGEEWKIDRN